MPAFRIRKPLLCVMFIAALAPMTVGEDPPCDNSYGVDNDCNSYPSTWPAASGIGQDCATGSVTPGENGDVLCKGSPCILLDKERRKWTCGVFPMSTTNCVRAKDAQGNDESVLCATLTRCITDKNEHPWKCVSEAGPFQGLTYPVTHKTTHNNNVTCKK